MRRIAVWSVCGLILVAGAWYALAPDDYRPMAMKSDFERFCLACEDTLKDRLKSPSSYKRLKCSGPYTDQATKASYQEHEKSMWWAKVDRYIKSEIEGGRLYITTAYVEYEAANSFGALVRGLESCSVDHAQGRSLVNAVGGLGPNVGGYDKTGWLLKTLKSN